MHKKQRIKAETVFCALWQKVIFLTYGYVPTKRIADALLCEEETVEREAARLGLLEAERFSLMQTKGYITLIRALWDVVPISQLLILLAMTKERFEDVLENEDFLSVKLGGHQPKCDPVRYSPLAPEAIQQTEELSKKIKKHLISRKRPMFDFFSDSCQAEDHSCSWISGGRRIVHGYLSPCGDVFGVSSKSYLPDTLLAEYQRRGINGIWIHGLLSSLSPYPFDLSLSEGYAKRRSYLKELIQRCRRYGIDVFLYFNEPRALPIEKFSDPALIGHRVDGKATLCFSNPKTRDYLYLAMKDFLEDVPDLGGIITITMSENPTHCHYRQNSNCPHCHSIPPEESAASVNNVILSAIRDSGSRAELIANLWGWSPFTGWSEQQIAHGLSLLDPDISVMCVSEYDLPISKGGVPSRIIDYSISNPGPSPITIDTLRQAAENGHRIYAKIQINNSWECSAVAYLPVFDLIYEHLTNLNALGVKDYMLTWTLGGYPSPMMDLVAEYAEKKEKFSLGKWYEKIFEKDANIVAQAVRHFCDGFREYPFSLDHLYYSPQTIGPANAWSRNPQDRRSTMVCYAFDDYETWIAPYPYEVYVQQMERLLVRWREGISVLDTASSTSTVAAMRRYAQAAAIHWEADLLHTQYAYEKRRGFTEKIHEIAIRECEIIKDLLALIREDPTIGFEASNHYYYYERTLLEKLLCTEKLFLSSYGES